MNCVKQMNILKAKGGSWRVAKSLGGTGKEGLLGEINKSAPNRDKEDDGSIGDVNHSSRVSDHNPDENGVVCARDFTHDPQGGFDSYKFADWLASRLKNGQENRVKYVISNRRIASGPDQGNAVGVWRKYTGSNPHDQHVHVSVRHPASYFDDEKSWGWSSTSSTAPKTCPCCGQKIPLNG